jgi:hypothetical protein
MIYHRHHIDDLTFVEMETFRRIPEVLIAGLVGSMPYAQGHYPFETEVVEQGFPQTLSPRV